MTHAPGALPSTPATTAPRPTRPLRGLRVLLGALAVLALSGVFLVVQQPPDVYARDVFGALRAPGEAAVIVGHRGDRAEAPENTLPSLALAMERLEFVETDVQLTRDGVPVLFHDRTLLRVAGDPHRIDELDLRQLRRLDVGARYDASYAGTRIPTLEEFLESLEGHPESRALVELKASWTPEEVATVVALIERSGVRNRIVLQSFSLETLASVAEVAPAIPRIMLARELPDDPRPLAERFGVIGFGTTAASVAASPMAVGLAHEAGLAVLCYTLNTEKKWTEVSALGVDGIITDRPSELDAWLAATAPGT